jgi:hypothetical protein
MFGGADSDDDDDTRIGDNEFRETYLEYSGEGYNES